MKQQPKKAPSAFDVWLDRGLHALYDDVANAPLPPDILRLLDNDPKR